MNIGETQFSSPEDRPVIIITRRFHAPPHAVYEAMITPQRVERWYGPRRYEVRVEEMDVRPGGRWQILNVDREDGSVWGFHGQYLEVVPDKRISQTWVFEGAPDQEVIETAELEPRDGETDFTAVAEYPSFEAREGVLGAGGNEGAAESYERLDEVLASMRANA